MSTTPSTAASLHHIGVAVPALDAAIAHHVSLLGGRLLGEPVEDPLQRVRVCFIARDGEPLLELVAPASDPGRSPIALFLERQIGAYHLCYEVDDLSMAIAHARRVGCRLVSGPMPAVAFLGRSIAWSFSPATRQLTEWLERPRPTADLRA